jgi:hypothetical protein
MNRLGERLNKLRVPTVELGAGLAGLLRRRRPATKQPTNGEVRRNSVINAR